MKRLLILLGLLVSVASYGQWEYNPFTKKLDKVSDLSTVESRLDSTVARQLGWYDVRDYGAVGDGVTDDSEAIMAACAAAKNSTVYFPGDTFLCNITVGVGNNYTPRLIGAGSAAGNNTNTTILKAALDSAVVYYDMSDQNSSTGEICNILFLANGGADSSNQKGVEVLGEADLHIHDCFFYGFGDYGIRINNNAAHVGGIWIENNRFQSNKKGGIYGVGKTSSYQINGLYITGNQIKANDGYGIKVAGTTVIISDNMFQANDSAGVLISMADFDLANSANNIKIERNHFELNGGGSIYAEVAYKNSKARVIENLTINDNWFYDLNTEIKKPEVTACITFALEPGSSDVDYFDDCVLGPNGYTSTGVTNFDGNNVLDRHTTVYISADGVSEFVGITGATIIEQGKVATPYKQITPTAAGGITSAMLGPNLMSYWEGGSDTIDITANPQIAAGYDGQEICIFQCGAAGKALKFDDGNGIDTADEGSVTISLGEGIGFRYHSFLGTWREIWRNDQ